MVMKHNNAVEKVKGKVTYHWLSSNNGVLKNLVLHSWKYQCSDLSPTIIGACSALRRP